ncbi:MAG: Nramp family divalent metal transporter [Coriobacteriales bacterium]|nr:Nramp family divalent metal transporter [Coriobacteriales bacterium]
MGPGIVAAMAGNDAGGIAAYSIAGASYGYGTLWTIPIMMIMLILVQETCMRMGAVTGKGLSSLIRENFGIRLAAFAMFTLFLANFGTAVSQFAGVAAGMELFGVSKYISVPVAAVAVWLLVIGGSYKSVQRIFLLIACVFATYVVAAFMSHPNWGQVATSTIIPHFETSPAFISLIMAAIGTTIAPWMLFFTQNNIVDKGVTTKDIFYQRIDITSGGIVACAVAWFIIITTGTVLYPQGIVIADAADAANALAPVAGAYAQKLFGIGLVGASLLACCVLPLTTSYAICEAFGWEHGLDRKWREAPTFKTMYTAIVAFSAALVLIPGLDLIWIIMITQVMNGALLPILLVFTLKLAGDKHLMGTHRNSKGLTVVLWVMVVVVTVLTIAMLAMQALGIG